MGEDRLVNAELSRGDEDILLATQNGMAIRFPLEQVRCMGRVAQGVRGISLRGEDKVVSMELVTPEDNLLLVSAKGIGKRISVKNCRIQNRGGVGVIGIKVSEKTGQVIGAMTIGDKDDFMAITADGMIIRTSVKNVRIMGRAAQGVKVMRLNKQDEVVSIARIQ